MREILFRGKRIDNGEWVFGDLRHDYDQAPRCISDYCGANPVDPDTVGQYTGLTANGKKIFEGDICRICLDPQVCVGCIEWDERVAAFIIRYNENSLSLLFDYWQGKQKVGDKVWLEVIGNCHDNPELLKGGAENEQTD